MAGALAAGGTALTGILSALGNQQKKETVRPSMEATLPTLLASDKKKFKKLQKEADKQRIYNFLMQPEVLGLTMTLGGMILSKNIPFSKNKNENNALQSIGVTSSVLLGLGHAGVGDLTTLVIAAAAGGSNFVGGNENIIGLTGGDSGAGILGTLWDYSPAGTLWRTIK